MAILMENGDTVFSAKSQSAETMTKPPNPFTKLLIAHSHIATNHSLSMRIELDSLWKKLIQRHDLSPPR
jgi:hypothetical protein